MDPRRQIPSVDRLLGHVRLREALEIWSRQAVLAVVRDEVERARAGAGPPRDTTADASGPATPFDDDALAARCADRLAALARPRPRRLINATGVVVHTNLGRAPLGPRAVEWLTAAAQGYCDLEYDVAQGDRGHRQAHVADLLALTAGGERAIVVNNNAAALVLILNTLARGRDVLISRGELVEIGGSFRVPEILERAGARLVEVGTTNRTHAADFAAAIGPETGLILRVWPSNYRVVGFTTAVPLEELAQIGRRAGVPVVTDQGCGRLFDTAPGPATEPAVDVLLREGSDLVCFSGDKLLGGPQAGVIVGRRDLVERCAKNPLMRALRPDKLQLAALAATLASWLSRDPGADLPVYRMLAADAAEMRPAADRLAAAIVQRVARAQVTVRDGISRVGGGAAPEEDLPTVLVAVRVPQMTDARLVGRLRQAPVPVIARIEDGDVLLDPRTLLDGEIEDVADAFAFAAAPLV